MLRIEPLTSLIVDGTKNWKPSHVRIMVQPESLQEKNEDMLNENHIEYKLN
jgi:hypothetical protein